MRFQKFQTKNKDNGKDYMDYGQIAFIIHETILTKIELPGRMSNPKTISFTSIGKRINSLCINVYAWRCIITQAKYLRLPSAELVVGKILSIRHRSKIVRKIAVWEKVTKKL